MIGMAQDAAVGCNGLALHQLVQLLPFENYCHWKRICFAMLTLDVELDLERQTLRRKMGAYRAV